MRQSLGRQAQYLHLADEKCLAVDVDWRERAATGEYTPTLVTQVKTSCKRNSLTELQQLQVKRNHTSVHVYASSAVHSALLVGLERAKMTGLCTSDNGASKIDYLHVKKSLLVNDSLPGESPSWPRILPW